MGNVQDEEMEIDLRALFFELKKNIWLILSVVIISTCAAGLYSKFVMVPQYTSTSMLYILSKETTLTSLADLQIGSQLTKDYRVLVTSRPVLSKVLDNLGIAPNQMNYRQFRSKITMDNPVDTRLMNITVQDADPVSAKAYADEIAKVSSKYIAEVMEMTPPKIIEEGELADSKASPNLKKNALIGGLLGGLAVCALLVAAFLMNDTIKTEADIERHLGLSVLAAVPVHTYEAELQRRRMRRDKKRTKRKKAV